MVRGHRPQPLATRRSGTSRSGERTRAVAPGVSPLKIWNSCMLHATRHSRTSCSGEWIRAQFAIRGADNQLYLLVFSAQLALLPLNVRPGVVSSRRSGTSWDGESPVATPERSGGRTYKLFGCMVLGFCSAPFLYCAYLCTSAPKQNMYIYIYIYI